MDGGDGSYRVEAERWLTISEKLLIARDLQGAKAFAIRARESDPRLLHFSDQIIAIADTLLAAEIRVKDHYGAATDTHDYYALLQLGRLTQSMELIASQYRKLALLLNPNRNHLAYAEQAFRLVSDAWMLFSNPSKKVMYDSLLQPVQLGLSAAQFANQGFVDGPAVMAHVNPQSPVRSGSRVSSVGVESEPVTTTNQWVPVSTQSTRQPTYEYQFTDTAATVARPAAATTQHFLPQQPAKPVAQQEQPPQPPPTTDSPRPTPPPVWISQSQQPAADRPVEAPLKVTPESSRPAAPLSVPESPAPVASRPATIEAQQPQPPPPPPPPESKVPTFWTACPYCYILYEYPKVYEECALKCQTCKRGFHAVAVPSPPVSSKDTYFCCWGFFPLGYSGGGNKFGLGGSNWSPFSAMFSTPLQPGGQLSSGAGKGSRPKTIYKDDVYLEISDLSSDDDKSDSDDDDWDRSSAKKPKRARGRPSSKNVKKVNARKGIRRNVDGSSSDGVRHEMVAANGEGSSSGKKVKGGKDLGKLDLNVMFSNEGDEAAPGVSERNGNAHGVEDNIEGISFFEGLDEFLSSLPILSVVGDEKVKAT